MERKQIKVAAAVICRDDRVFATQRGYGSYKDWWEFPGGKVENGETPEEALVREIREELNTEIVVDRFLITVEYDYPEFHLSMDCFWCHIEERELTLLEHEAAKWLLPDNLRQVKWLPADVLVVEAIEASRAKGQTNEPPGPERKDATTGAVPLEIERKFLIRYPDPAMLARICVKQIRIAQTYLISEKGKSRRIRKSESGGNTVYWYNEKERISDLTRIEREREITEKEYLDLMREARPEARTIYKTRYCIPSGAHCFEVDLFPEWDDRAFAEVELEAENQPFEIPECLSVIREVTEDRRYTNLSLALNGFIREPVS